MRRNILAGAFLLAIILGGALALSQTETTEAQGPPTFSLPSQAVLVSPGVWSLGTTVINGRLAEGFAIATHKGKTHGGPFGGGGGGDDGGDGGDGGSDPAAGCFSFLGNGARWRTNAGAFLLNAANSRGLDGDALVTALDIGALEQWDDQVAFDMFGGGSLTTDPLVADTTAELLDYQSEVYFADISNNGAIAFTIVWGYFRGPPSSRELIAWDMVFDDFDFDWSLSGEDGKMDFLNIAAHEAGHAVGMGHTDTSDTCIDQTMYPSASRGETDKRDLGVGDIAGVVALYQ